MLSPIEIRQVLEETVGSEEAEDIVSGQRSVVTSCGSGMTAGILWLGLQLLGARKVALYDEAGLLSDSILLNLSLPSLFYLFFSLGQAMRSAEPARLLNPPPDSPQPPYDLPWFIDSCPQY